MPSMKNLVKFTREILQDVGDKQEEEQIQTEAPENSSTLLGFSNSTSLKKIFQNNLQKLAADPKYISLVNQNNNAGTEGDRTDKKTGTETDSLREQTVTRTPVHEKEMTSSFQAKNEGRDMPSTGFSDSDFIKNAIKDSLSGIQYTEVESETEDDIQIEEASSDSQVKNSQNQTQTIPEPEIKTMNPVPEIGLSGSDSFKNALFKSFRSGEEEESSIPAPEAKPGYATSPPLRKPEPAATPAQPVEEKPKVEPASFGGLDALKEALRSQMAAVPEPDQESLSRGRRRRNIITPAEIQKPEPGPQEETAVPQATQVSKPVEPPKEVSKPTPVPKPTIVNPEPAAQRPVVQPELKKPAPEQQTSGKALSQTDVRNLEAFRNEIREKMKSSEEKEEEKSATDIKGLPIHPKVRQMESTEEEKYATQLYMELHRAMGEVVDDIKAKRLINPKTLEKLAPSLCESIKLSETLFLKAIQRKRFATWLISHSVNVAIFAAKIARGFKYDEKKQAEVTLAALLHDVGMVQVPNRILFKHGKLTPAEFDYIREHPSTGFKLVEHLRNEYPYILETVYEEQEREDGSGYPRGLKGDKIHEYAKIVGIADVFEALVHGRAYRPGFITYHAIQKIMERNAKQYNPKIIRALISVISMFPVGSLVQLSSGEIAKVISINQNRSVRPVVDVIQDSDGNAIEPPKRINLEQEPLIYITKPITE